MVVEGEGEAAWEGKVGDVEDVGLNRYMEGLPLGAAEEGCSACAVVVEVSVAGACARRERSVDVGWNAGVSFSVVISPRALSGSCRLRA